MPTPETFCNSIGQFVCVRCPLRNIDERRWSHAVLEGVTPYDAAHAIGTAVLEAHDRLRNEAGAEEALFGSIEPHEAEEYKRISLILHEGDVDPQISSKVTFEGFVSDFIVAEDLRGKILRRGSDKTRGVVRAFGACVAKQGAGKCSIETLYRPAAPALQQLFRQLITAESGADVLDDFARHGDLATVRDKATKVGEVILDALNRHGRLLGMGPADFYARPEYVARGYLMLIAKALRSGVLNTDAPGTLD